MGKISDMRAAARAVLDTPGLVEKLADACYQAQLGGWPQSKGQLAATIRRTCEETAREGASD